MTLSSDLQIGIELATNVRNARYTRTARPSDFGSFSYITGYEECAPSYDLCRSSFPYLTLEIVVGGCGHLTLHNRPSHIHPGFCFCTGPGTPFRLRSSRAKPLQKYFVVFGPNQSAKKAQGNAPLYPGYSYTFSNPLELKKWSELILEESGSQDHHAVANVSSLIDVLLRKTSPAAHQDPQPRTTGALVFRAIKEIESQFKTLKSTSQIAARFEVSSEHLCRAFKSCGRRSPYKILSQRKMDHAFAQLKLSQASVQDIAHSLGFSDAFHFSRSFKKHFGFPPSQARK